MKQVTLDVKPEKYKFFMELVKSFEFVSVSKKETEKNTLMSIARGMKEAELAAKGKIKTKSAKSFVNGL
jgi:hypothetical protein